MDTQNESAEDPSSSSSSPSVLPSPLPDGVLLRVFHFICNLKARIQASSKLLQKKSAAVKKMLLYRFPILSRAPPLLLQQLCSKAQKRLIPRKSVLLQQGAVSPWVYLVQMGSFAILQQSEHVRMGEASRGGGRGGSPERGGGPPRFESMQLGEVGEGEEAGMYGLLRPHTVIGGEQQQSRRRVRKQKGHGRKASSEAGDDLDSEASEEEADRRSRSHYARSHSPTRSFSSSSSSSSSSPPPVGYPQPHTYLSTQPSIVFALSGHLFREVLLSAPHLYEEVRQELTSQYMVRVRRFERWEIGRMRASKIQDIQRAILDSHTQSTGVRPNSAVIQAAYIQAEKIVSRDSLADLFHGRKRVFTAELTQVAEDTAGEEAGEASGASEEVALTEEEILISAWVAQRSGGMALQKGAALSKEAPHHPASTYYKPTLHSPSSPTLSPTRVAPLPFVDTRKLTGSRRVYDFKCAAGGGGPTKHPLTPSPNQKLLLAQQKNEEAIWERKRRMLRQAQMHTLADEEEEQPASSSSSLLALDLALDSDDPLSPEDLAFYRRVQRLQAKAHQKDVLRQAQEEEKFLEDIMSVALQVQEMRSNTQGAIKRVTPSSDELERMREVLSQQRGGMERRSGEQITSSSASASASASPSHVSFSLDSVVSPAAGSPVPSVPSGESLSSPPRPAPLKVPGSVDSSPASPIQMSQDSNKREGGEEGGAGEAQAADQTAFPTHSPTDASSHQRSHSQLSSASFSPESPSSSRPSPHPPPSNQLPPLTSSQLKSLFQVLHASGTKDNPALLLLNSLQASQAVPTRHSEHPQSKASPSPSPSHKSEPSHLKTSIHRDRSPTLHRRHKSVLVDLSPQHKPRAPSPLPPAPPPEELFKDLPVDPTAASYKLPTLHALSLHSFTGDVWKGLTRLPTPPLLPPHTIDTHHESIRAGVERAMIRVRSRSRSENVLFKEFSRENKKESLTLKTVANEADRRQAMDTLARIAAAEGREGGEEGGEEGHHAVHSPSTVDSSSPSLSPKRHSRRLSLTHQHDPAEVQARAQKPLSVLSVFAAQKDKDRKREAELKAKKEQEEEAARREHKRQLHRTREVRRATALRFSFDLYDPPSAASSPPLSPLASPSSSSSSPSHPLHDTLLSPHHKRVFGSLLPRFLDSSSASLTPPVESHEEREWKKGQAEREKQNRMRLLREQHDTSKSPTGMEADARRTQMQQEESDSLPPPKLDVPDDQDGCEGGEPAVSSSSSPSPSSSLPPLLSPTRASLPLGSSKSRSLHPPSIPNPLEGSQSSLTRLLTQVHKDKSDLLSSFPSLGTALNSEDSNSGVVVSLSPSDRSLIDSLLSPSHQLHSHLSMVSSQLTHMLWPFREGSNVMEGKGIRIPTYEEKEEHRTSLIVQAMHRTRIKETTGKRRKGGGGGGVGKGEGERSREKSPSPSAHRLSYRLYHTPPAAHQRSASALLSLHGSSFPVSPSSPDSAPVRSSPLSSPVNRRPSSVDLQPLSAHSIQPFKAGPVLKAKAKQPPPSPLAAPASAPRTRVKLSPSASMPQLLAPLQ